MRNPPMKTMHFRLRNIARKVRNVLYRLLLEMKNCLEIIQTEGPSQWLAYGRLIVQYRFLLPFRFRPSAMTQQAYALRTLSRREDDLIVDIILPVYRGYSETVRCIESVLDSPQKRGFELIVINDCSPEPAIVDYLKGLSSQPHVSVVNNPENRGFVNSVNAGMSLHSGRDVMLLNSDTLVAGDWLDRMAGAAESSWNIGTVTPFTNNGTICSYPCFCQDNRMPDGYTCEKLDRVFREFPGKTVDIPTAVGFCTFIKRACLEDTGLFDADHFGKGYGEENDFCMRAHARGWRHVLTTDTFVYHVGTVSFENAFLRRKDHVFRVLKIMHPDYFRMVEDHIHQDPALPCRRAVDLARVRADSRPVVLMVNHNQGGGTEKHVKELTDLLNHTILFLTLRPEVNGYVSVSWDNPGECLILYFKMPGDFGLMMSFFRIVGVRRIHFHHLLHLPPVIQRLPEELAVPYDVTLHDFFMICPNIFLVDQHDEYCGEKGTDFCMRCAADQGVDIEAWRRGHHAFLKKADRIIAPSVDAACRINACFADLTIIAVCHPDSQCSVYPMPVTPCLKPEDKLRVVVMGALPRRKGADMLNEVALLSRKKKSPLEFHLLGYAYKKLAVKPFSSLKIHGAYSEKTFVPVLEKINPHIAWIPALWPETYSYVLSELMTLGVPVAATRIGAFPERLMDRPLSWTLDWQTSPSEWIDFFLAVRMQFLEKTCSGSSQHSGIEPISCFSYKTDYPGVIGTGQVKPADFRPCLEPFLSLPANAFDEVAYLQANMDVADYVAAGKFASGREHWVKYGKKEGRRLQK